MKRMMALEQRGISDSRLVFGCMSLGGDWTEGPYSNEDVVTAERAVDAALSIGITMYDHADIYRRGKAERVFREVLKKTPGLREKIVLQTKCGIRLADEWPGRYDFSREHILRSVDGSLERLGTEYVDVLLLHRPDPLVEPDEVAEAFVRLKQAGKVRNFGVSNMSPGQIRFLQRALPDPFVVNQIEMSLNRLDWVDHGVKVNQREGTEISFPEGLLEFCQTERIQLQAWGPLAQGRYSGRDIAGEPESVRSTADLVGRMASDYGTAPESIVLGWLMKHPALIQPVIGTANPERILACRDAVQVSERMSREEWYNLYVTSRGRKI